MHKANGQYKSQDSTNTCSMYTDLPVYRNDRQQHEEARRDCQNQVKQTIDIYLSVEHIACNSIKACHE